MRALQLAAYEGPVALQVVEIDAPRRKDDELLVEVEAIGINFPDLLATRGHYQHKPALPFVPGCEIAGTVREAPKGSGFAVGDRVAAFVWDGGYAETVAAPLKAAMSIPDMLDTASAAAMVVNYHTVLFGLVQRGRLRPGETVLVLGAGGGIGSAAVQVARGLGARVLAGVASEDQREIAEQAGADEVLILDKDFSVPAREWAEGRGVDIVIDPLGDWLFDEAFRALAPEGRLLVIGFAAGAIPTVKVNRLLLRNVAVVGVAWGAFLDVDPSLMPAASATLMEMATRGAVAPTIGRRYAFEDIPDALASLARGEVPGKAVATFSP